MKILSLNCNFYMDKTGPWPKRRALMTDMIHAFDPDVMAVQAVKAGQVDELALSSFQEHIFSTVDGQDGLGLLSRRNICGLEKLVLSLHPSNTEDLSLRLVQKALIEPGNIWVLNACLSWVESQNRKNIEELISFLESCSGPALLVGDFNAPAPAEVLRPLQGKGWTDLWGLVHPQEPGFTYPSPSPVARIDYAWANDFLVGRIKGIHIIGQQAREGVFASDHFGLCMELI